MYKSILIAIFSFILFVKTTAAQYYFKDILNTKQLVADLKVLKEQKVRTVIVHSFERDNEPSEGFFCEKKISKDHRKIETLSKSLYSSRSILTSYFNEKGQLTKTTDSSELNASFSIYTYNDSGNVTSILSRSHSKDDDFSTSLAEVHQYIYGDSARLKKMLRIKDQKDTTEIDFVYDVQGNVAEEIEVALYGNHYYYYYDGQNRLTDIVRFNVVKGKPLPDFMYEYNEDGQLAQMVAIDEGVTSNYYIWRYVYNGPLRIKEKCYSKDKKLQGYIEYEYQ